MSSSEKRSMPLAPAETLAGYDRWAESYDATVNPMVGATAAVLDRVPLACSDLDVIELGCGTGRNVARVLAEGAHRYHGIDGSSGMLDRARTALVDPRVTFEASDVHHPLGGHLDGQFDLVLIVLVLEHVVDARPLLASAHRALRAGGRLRIVEIHPSLVEAGTVAHFDDHGTEVRFTSTAHPPPALSSALGQAGFGVIRLREWSADELASVPKLAKHRGRSVILDITAQRP